MDTIKKVKRQPTELGNTFTKHISDKRFESREYKKLLQLNNEKTNKPIIKRTKDLNGQFPKEDIKRRSMCQ